MSMVEAEEKEAKATANFFMLIPGLGFIAMICAVLYLIGYSVYAAGGTETLQQKLDGTGVLGRHRIEQMPADTQELHGTAEGGGSLFFHLSGQIDGEDYRKFTWSPESGVYVTTAVPLSKVRTIIDEAKNVPEFEFVFEPEWLEEKIYGEYTDLEKEDLNRIVRKGYTPASNYFGVPSERGSQLVLVRVYLSSETAEKEPFLPGKL